MNFCKFKNRGALIAALALTACGKPLNSFCTLATVTERDHRNAYSYLVPYSYTTGSGTTRITHYGIRTVYVPEKNYVVFQSGLSRQVLNDRYWYDNTFIGKKVDSCYRNYETNHWFDDGKDTTAHFTHIQPQNQAVERANQNSF